MINNLADMTAQFCCVHIYSYAVLVDGDIVLAGDKEFVYEKYATQGEKQYQKRETYVITQCLFRVLE